MRILTPIKLILVLGIALLATQKGNAQKITEGSLFPIYGQEVINCAFEFTDSEIGGMPFDEFVEWKMGDGRQNRDFDEELDNEIVHCQMIFMEHANEKLKGTRLAKRLSAKYTLTVKLATMDMYGRDNTCDYIFTETESGKKIAVIRMDAHGGRFGSFTNLMGDAFEEAGENFGKFLNKQLQQIGKNSKKK